MKIYKYPLAFQNEQTVRLPVGAAVLSIQEQGMNSLQLWAMVDEYAPTQDIRITMVPTGSSFTYDPRMIFVSTVQARDGLVWHFFRWAP